MKELLIKIKSLFEGKGQIDAATKSISDLGTETEKTSTITGGMAGKIGGWLAGLASFSAAVAVAGRAMREFAAKQEAVATLDQALRNAGQASHTYRESLQQLAGQLQSTTAIGDEMWYGVFEMLTKMGSTQSTIHEHTEAVKNLAGATGMDIQQAAVIFGKAMQGNTDMLGRYGITVDKSLSQTEQLNQIMATLAQRGGGILEERAKTINGQLQNLNNSVGDLLATMGQMASEGNLLGDAIGHIQYSLDFWNQVLGRTIPPVSNLTERVRMQTLAVEEVEAAQTAAAASTKEFQDAQAAADAAIEKNIQALDGQKRALLETARLERDLAIEKVRAGEGTEAEKIQAIADINSRFRETELNAEKANEDAKARIRLQAAQESADALAALKQEAEAKAAAAATAQAEAAAATEAAAAINKQQQIHEQLLAEKAAYQERLKQITNEASYDAETDSYDSSKTTYLYGGDELRAEADALAKAYAAVNEQLAKTKEFIETAPEVATDATVRAQQAQIEADALAEQVRALEERSAALLKQATEEKTAADEKKRSLEEVKTIEQEIADIKDGAAKKQAEENAARLEQLEKERQERENAQKNTPPSGGGTASGGSSRGGGGGQGGGYSPGGGTDAEGRFAREDAFKQLSNKRQLEVQREMQQKYGAFTDMKPEDYFAGMTPEQSSMVHRPNELGGAKLPPGQVPGAPPPGGAGPMQSPGTPGAGGPQSPGAGDQQSAGTEQIEAVKAAAEAAKAALEALATAAKEGFTGIAEAATKSTEALTAGSESTKAAASSAAGAADAIKGSLTELRQRISNLENSAK